MQTFVEFGVFAVLQLAGLPFRLANAVAVFCSGSFNYVMNRNVTFKSSSNYARSIAMFVAMYCWNLLFSNLMMAWIPDCSLATNTYDEELRAFIEAAHSND